MKIHLLALCLVIGLTGQAWARLGETSDQLVARYGGLSNLMRGVFFSCDAVHVDLHWILFHKSGFEIVVALFNGVSSMEEINTSQRDSMTDQEIKTLLDANAQDHHTWKEVTGGGVTQWPQDNGTTSLIGGKVWLRDDGAMACANGTGFTIKSKELIDAEVAAHKAAHVHSLEGF